MSGRLTQYESFRARAWRDIQRQSRVLALSNCAHRLLVGIVHVTLTPYNNGALNLGPASLRQFGFRSKAGIAQAVRELVEARLLMLTTEPRQGARTHYMLTVIPLAVDVATIKGHSNLPTGGEPDLPTGGEVTPENLPTGGEDFPTGGEVENVVHIRTARTRTRAEEASESEMAEMHSQPEMVLLNPASRNLRAKGQQ